MSVNVGIRSGKQLPIMDSPNIGMGTFLVEQTSDKAFYVSWAKIGDMLGVNMSSAGYAGIAQTNTVPVATGTTRYLVAAAGTYTNFKDVTNASIVIATEDLEAGQVELWGQSNVFIKKIIPTNLAAAVLKNDLATISGKNLYRSSYQQFDRAISSIGTIGVSVGATSIVGIPVTGGQFYTVSGYGISSSKNLAFVNNAGEVQELSPGVYRTTLFFATTTIQAPLNATKMQFTVKLNGEPDTTYTNLQVERGTSATSYAAPVDFIATIGSSPIQALQIAPGNTTADPVDDLNAVNLRHFNRVAIKESNLTIEYSPNLGDPYYIVHDRYINNIGARVTGAGWTSISVPVTPGKTYTYGRFTISSGGYAAFYDAVGNYISGTVHTVNGTLLPITKVAPAGAAFLDIDIGRPGNTGYDQFTMNEGSSLIDYVSALSKVIKINRYALAGSGGSAEINSFFDIKDVPPYIGNENKALKYSPTSAKLETFVPVEQYTAVTFTSVNAAALRLLIPEGATRPGGMALDDAWLDTSVSAADPTVKVKRT